MNLTVFGIGYVGLVQAAVLAEVGHEVVCVDIDEAKVERLNQGFIPIFEPGLEALVKENHAAGRIRFTTDAAAAVKHGQIQMIAVGTPPGEDGSAVADCMKPDRIIVGTSSEATEAVMRELYAPFNRNHEKMIVMDVRSAEFTKYAANCMLATKISFMNEMANLAEQLGADIEEVRKGIGSDPRIGYHFIYPGLGYGGSCFPKDVRALIKTAEGVKFDAKLLRAVEERNNAQKSVLFDKVNRYFQGALKGKTFALWGLAFKPNTDDMREAPSRTLMEALWAAGAKVQAYDPEAMQECQAIYGQREDLLLCGTKEAALRGADALLICTEWKSFRAPSFDALKDALSTPVIFDGRNLYDPRVIARYGIEYHSIGRMAA
ncbi:MAG: UDP-glucose/GDP-mannose dehydrogenase family protein [Mesorhizobium sp.]|nr:MAG: UDP-glucose/GDP-mannose dehydrogenase family protein [Mesorhizobium sp.]